MKIAIIGTGNVGRALGQAWCQHGHDVSFGSREPEGDKAQAAVEGTNGKARALQPALAARGADVVLVATPWGATQAVIASLGDLSGKVLIDATNPIAPGLQLAVGHTTSGGEQVAGWAPAARVVKAFNTVGANLMTNPSVGGIPVSLLICGDDADAKAVVAQLGHEIGFDVVDAGPLNMARCLEPMAILWIRMSMSIGRGMGFKLLRS